jgi:hypothetical protein
MSGDRLYFLLGGVPSEWKTALDTLFFTAVIMILASIKSGLPWKLLNGTFRSHRESRRNVWDSYEDFPDE